MRLLPILGILAVAANLQAQPQAAINRQPVSEEVFATVADHYGYDRSQPLDASVIGVWPHRLPYVIEKVEFSSIHNERVSAYFTHPKDSTATRHPAVLLLHGANDFWGRTRTGLLSGWIFSRARDGVCWSLIFMALANGKRLTEALVGVWPLHGARYEHSIRDRPETGH